MLKYTFNVIFTANAFNASDEDVVVFLVVLFVNVAQNETYLVKYKLLTCLANELDFRITTIRNTTIVICDSIITITTCVTVVAVRVRVVAIEHSVKCVHTFINHFHNLRHNRLRFVLQHTAMNITVLRFELHEKITHTLPKLIIIT
jgi:hypothetical protein